MRQMYLKAFLLQYLCYSGLKERVTRLVGLVKFLLLGITKGAKVMGGRFLTIAIDIRLNSILKNNTSDFRRAGSVWLPASQIKCKLSAERWHSRANLIGPSENNIIMEALAHIYEQLDREEQQSRVLPILDNRTGLAPWNSLGHKTPHRIKQKMVMASMDQFLKTSRVKSYSLQNIPQGTPSKLRQSIKRTSYCFQTQTNNLAKELLASKRYSSDHSSNLQQFPQLSSRAEKKTKIKSFNEQEQLRKYATIQKLSSVEAEDRASSCYKTMFLLHARKNGVELRNRNIQMIRHISQRKMGVL